MSSKQFGKQHNSGPADADPAQGNSHNAEDPRDNENHRLTKHENSKPLARSSNTAMSVFEENEDQKSVLFGEHLDDEDSEYFSMLGEIGKYDLKSPRIMDMRLEDVEEMRKMFNVFDQDSNGVITANELRSIMSSLGQSTTEAEVMDMVNSIGMR